LAESMPSLGTVLASDGAIVEGASGSYDPAGFRMEYGPDGEPLFVEEGSSPWEPVPLAGELDLDGTWFPLGDGLSGFVHAITENGSDVYVGGLFTLAGGGAGVVLANYITRWDGSSWSALGSGVNGYVEAIAVSSSDMYAGGVFTQAGGTPANYIARWEPDTGIEPSLEIESSVLLASPNPTTAGIELSFQSTGLSPLTFEIYDAAGRLVRTQDLGILPTGSQTHYWDGLDGNGNALAQGVYFLRLSSADLDASTRVVLLR
ncbi:MAG: FlgD immunoglobulin-like domain containing protein, partial [Candidatus Fermentibacter sp.]|nr:FlgD immunoglobulin-like domain containing protein [Candidatus Fermentibacter sp.]